MKPCFAIYSIVMVYYYCLYSDWFGSDDQKDCYANDFDYYPLAY